jgi:hypothetical protein
MKTEAKIILETSPDAASIKTVTGWVASNGRFWGDDERMARYDGSTHRTCECGELVEQRSYCHACRRAKELAKFAAMERRPWDGVSMIYSYALDRYFRDTNDVIDFCHDEEVTPADLRLILCEPTFAREIDESEHFSDDLPEDGDVPADLVDAFEALNKVIRECKTPLSWFPGKFALDLDGIE